MKRIANETYVLRVYRRDAAKPDCVQGIVEAADQRTAWRFGSLSELMAILNGSGQVRPTATRHGRRT